MAKDALGHGSDGRGTEHQMSLAGQHGVPTSHLGPRDQAIANAVNREGPTYVGSVTNKSGRVLAETGPHPDHETAARAAFAMRPNAKTVSTYRASGMDIRWHNRPKG